MRFNVRKEGVADIGKEGSMKEALFDAIKWTLILILTGIAFYVAYTEHLF
jgi:hypothetical protein